MWDLIVSVPDHCLSFLLFKNSFAHLIFKMAAPIPPMLNYSIVRF